MEEAAEAVGEERKCLEHHLRHTLINQALV